MKKLKELDQKSFEDMVGLDQNFLNYFWNDSQWISFIESYPNNAYVQLLYQGHHLNSFALYLRNEIEQSIHLLKVVTHPLERGKGIATGFLEDAFKFIGEGGKVFLEVSIHNKNAISVYKKLGFETTREMKRFYSDGSDALEMLKVVD